MDLRGSDILPMALEAIVSLPKPPLAKNLPVKKDCPSSPGLV